eukprot:248168_1
MKHKADIPFSLALVISFIFTTLFIWYIHKRATKKLLYEAKNSILFTIAFMVSNIIFWLGYIGSNHPPLSQQTAQNIYCVMFLFIRSSGANLSQYFSQLFFISRIGVILNNLLASIYTQKFYKILLILVHIVLIVNYTFTILILVKQNPTYIGKRNTCEVLSSGAIRPLVNGIYQLIILFTFIYITSKIICAFRNKSRIIRTIVAGMFVSIRIFVFPLYKTFNQYIFWAIAISDIINQIAILSDYYGYKISENIIVNNIQLQQQKEKETKYNHTATDLQLTITNKMSSGYHNVSSVEDPFIQVIDNGFTGKNIEPTLAQLVYKLWTYNYSKLSDDIKHKMDKEIHSKVSENIILPEYYKGSNKVFPYIAHLNKLFDNLLRMDIDLENKLRQSWGKLHIALNIKPKDCELVLTHINYIFKQQFGKDVYSIQNEYLFSRVYRLGITMMFCENETGFLQQILELNENDKQIITQSLNDCLNHDIGQRIMYSYLRDRDPGIYLFLQLVMKYKRCLKENNEENMNLILIVEDILKTSIHQDIAIFPIDISDHKLQNEFVASVSKQSDYENIGMILDRMREEQIAIVNQKYWETFVMFIF